MPDDNADNTNEEFNAAQAAAEFAAAVADEPPAEDARNYTAILEDEVEALGRLLAERDEALLGLQEKSAAAAAEADRVRARIEREADGTIERKRRAVLVSFLEVADDLHLAVNELSVNGTAPALAQGVQLVRDKLHTVLTQHGAERRPSLGHAFDPAHHDAVGIVPATADAPAGTVASVLQEGYELAGEPLRPARVVVAKAD